SSFVTVQDSRSPLDSFFVIRSVILFKTIVIGFKIKINRLIIGITSFPTSSGKAAAIDFGIISANKIILTVKIIVSTVKFKPYSIAIIVRSTGMTRFAILLPIKIVVINSLGLDTKLYNLFDFKFPAFASL